jgi:hypothetical protein
MAEPSNESDAPIEPASDEGGRWAGMYVVVLGALAVTLLLFALLTRAYDRSAP